MFHHKPVFNRRNQLNSDGKALVHIRIIHERKAHYYSTGILLYPQHWDSRKEEVKKSCKEWFAYNKAINDIRDKIEQFNANLIQSQQRSTYSQLKAHLEGGKMISGSGLLSFTKDIINNRTDLVQDTKNRHLGKVQFFKEYLGGDVSISSIDLKFILDLEKHLEQKGLSVNTRWNYHKFLKTYLNHAVLHDIISKNPYEKYKVAKEETTRDYLSLEEIKQLASLELEEEFKSHQLTLDKFLFSCYTGLRISDIEHINASNFEFIQDKVYLSFRMKKTVKFINKIPLHNLFEGKAIPIVKKYLDKDKKTLFPEQAQQNINSHLKDLGKLAKLEKKLTFHVARHSFGSALARVYGDVLLIKELMGHSKIETSMIYIHMNPKIIEEKLSKNKAW